MRKLLSVMLAVVMVFSVAVIAVSAVGTDAADTAAGSATVTLTGLKGESIQKTYAVGDTLTAFTYLNASKLNNGKIGSLNGTQEYTSSVLQIVDTYNTDTEAYDFGMVDDLDTMFPILGDATVANAGKTGRILYNASKAALSGFPFNTDTSALIVVRYKVIAGGTAQITNSMKTLAESDTTLTRIIDNGVIKLNDFTTPVKLSEPTMPISSGATVSGTITSYLSDDTVTVALKGTDNNFTASATGINSYEINDVPNGKYVLTVSKKNHVARDYEITVSGNATQDVTICPIGDANLNGKIQPNDAMKVYQNAQGKASAQLDGYAFKCADVNGNGKIQPNDAMKIYQQSQGKHSLF